MRRFVWIALAVLLPGCRLLDAPYERTDDEIQRAGEWTSGDEEARELLDRYVGPGRAVRYVSHAEKFTSVKGAVETITGLRYEKRYYFIPEKGVYVFPGRGKTPAFVIPEEPDPEPQPTAAAN